MPINAVTGPMLGVAPSIPGTWLIARAVSRHRRAVIEHAEPVASLQRPVTV